jgi:cytochrome c peroxidase
MYASFTPAFTLVTGARGPQARGGQFLDGRVDTLAQQALGPLLAAAEMNNPSAAAVVAKVAASTYAAAFKAEWGATIFTRTNDAFTAIGRSIEAYERSAEFRPFTSRYDDLLRGHDTFTAAEKRGMNAFFDPAKGSCVACHAADRGNANPSASLFTNHTYVALGVPRNNSIPSNASPTFYDLGLAGPNRTAPSGVTAAAGEFKVPTLRNVALKPAFMHNGRFSTLSEVVGFYATRDIDPRRWYPAGNPFNDLPTALKANVTHRPPLDLQPGDRPRLSPGDVSDIVAFLGTLTDVPLASTFSVAQ